MKTAATFNFCCANPILRGNEKEIKVLPAIVIKKNPTLPMQCWLLPQQPSNDAHVVRHTSGGKIVKQGVHEKPHLKNT